MQGDRQEIRAWGWEVVSVNSCPKEAKYDLLPVGNEPSFQAQESDKVGHLITQRKPLPVLS